MVAVLFGWTPYSLQTVCLNLFWPLFPAKEESWSSECVSFPSYHYCITYTNMASLLPQQQYKSFGIPCFQLFLNSMRKLLISSRLSSQLKWLLMQLTHLTHTHVGLLLPRADNELKLVIQTPATVVLYIDGVCVLCKMLLNADKRMTCRLHVFDTDF